MHLQVPLYIIVPVLFSDEIWLKIGLMITIAVASSKAGDTDSKSSGSLEMPQSLWSLLVAGVRAISCSL